MKDLNAPIRRYKLKIQRETGNLNAIFRGQRERLWEGCMSTRRHFGRHFRHVLTVVIYKGFTREAFG